MARKLKREKKSQPKSVSKRVMIINLKKRPMEKATDNSMENGADRERMDGCARNSKVCQ